jgi:hypothetical protein
MESRRENQIKSAAGMQGKHATGHEKDAGKN